MGLGQVGKDIGNDVGAPDAKAGQQVRRAGHLAKQGGVAPVPSLPVARGVDEEGQRGHLTKRLGGSAKQFVSGGREILGPAFRFDRLDVAEAPDRW